MLVELSIQLKLRYRMIVKVHKIADGRKIIAVCDKGLIGKRFEEGKLQLDLSSSFYDGKEKSGEELIELLKDSYIVNVVGGESLSFLLKRGFVDKKNIIKIKNIPHAQAILG